MSVLKAEFGWPSGDRPGKLNFCYPLAPPVAQVLTQALTPFLSLAKTMEIKISALSPPDGPVGRYWLSWLSAGNESWFVRVTTRAGNPELESSIISYLFSRGVNVNPFLVSGETLQWNGQAYRIDISPLIDGRHFNGSVEDLEQLASTISSCHRALADFPRAHEIQVAARVRYRRLAEIRDRTAECLRHENFEFFCEHAEWAVEFREWLAEMVERFEPYLDENENSQCVHGEIHQGNVLFRKTDGAAVLVDFEESTDLYVPLDWDLAFLVQRFCLYDKPSTVTLLDRIAVVAEKYGSPLPRLAPMMRQAAWFTMATLIDLRRFRGVVAPISEYDKFVRLEREGDSLEGQV